MDPEQMQQMAMSRPDVPPPPRSGIMSMLQFDNRLGAADSRVEDAMEIRRLRDLTAAQREAENVREALLRGLPVHFSELEDPEMNRMLQATRARRPLATRETLMELRPGEAEKFGMEIGMAGGGMVGEIPSYNTGGQMYSYTQAPELAPYYSNLLGQMQQYGAQNMYGTPAQQAALEAQQIYGMGTGPSEFDEAKNILTGDPTEYMNQYTQAVIDPQIRAAQEQAARSMQDLGGGAASQGAFGGGRHDILRGNIVTNLGQTAADITGRGMSEAYQDARQRQMAMFGGLAGLGRDREASQMARLGMFNQAATGAANLPYQNINQQVGLASQMGYRPTVYQGSSYQPGLGEQLFADFGDWYSSSPFLQQGTDPTKTSEDPSTLGATKPEPQGNNTWQQFSNYMGLGG